jgi:hypothetical protein
LPGQPPGDEIVELEILAPRAHTKEQREAYERMRDAFGDDWRREESRLLEDASPRDVVWFPCRAAEAASCPPRRERAAIHGRALVNHTTPRVEAHLI